MGRLALGGRGPRPLAAHFALVAAAGRRRNPGADRQREGVPGGGVLGRGGAATTAAAAPEGRRAVRQICMNASISLRRIAKGFFKGFKNSLYPSSGMAHDARLTQLQLVKLFWLC